MPLNRMPEPRTIAGGTIGMVALASTRFNFVQGCTGVSGGTGIATITLTEGLSDADMELTYGIINGPDGCSMKASKTGLNLISFLAHDLAGVLVNVGFTFSVRKRGQLK